MLAAFVLTALAAAGPQAPTSTRASVMDSAGRDPIALTLSGGVSLGAYEAGLTWSLVQFLRIPETDDRPAGNLVAVTGASAGGLNTVLAAALWCEAPDEPGDAEVEHNLLHDT
ncbi:MAG: hypothetical protein JST92_00490, partial [Deltaproteobacteria bacterium]|nr:hypothetical protein [Deltaproteobacteria bacterium]